MALAELMLLLLLSLPMQSPDALDSLMARVASNASPKSYVLGQRPLTEKPNSSMSGNFET